MDDPWKKQTARKKTQPHHQESNPTVLLERDLNIPSISPPTNPIRKRVSIPLDQAVKELGQTPTRSELAHPWRNPTLLKTNPIISKRSFVVRHRHNLSVGRESYGKGSGKGGMKRMIRSMRKEYKKSNKMKEIKKLDEQNPCKNSIPLRPLIRLVKGIMIDVANEKGLPPMRFQVGAFDALREFTESLLISFFEDCQMFVTHAKRVTLMPRDIQLAMRLRQKNSNK